VAVALDMGAAVVFGGNKAQKRALLTVNVLGDVCEALIAAIYLDGGLDAARHFVAENWRDRMLDAPLGGRNAKSALQEWAQAQGHGTPTYEIAERTGPDHAPTFVICVNIGTLPPGSGEGRSRREAEQAAATAVLLREGIWQTTR
jgi:ribonuclease-3